jgi:uncharacterized membrane protein (DUF4010 family)
MDLTVVFEKVAIAVGLGLLVGMQRERVQSPLAGIRTFALITAFGAVSALLALPFGGWVVAAGAVAVAAVLAVGNLVQPNAKETDPGVTTEIAALLMYAVGAYLVVGHTAVGIALGGGVALLLHFKGPMHEFVARIGETDLKAIMQFVLIALVILPVLPDQTFGPYDVLNPHNIWLMVVLIVAISLAGYVAHKLVGQKAGAVLAGALGGLISSTATTVSYARRTRAEAGSIPVATVAILSASAVAFARVLAEIAVVAPSVFWQMAPPLGIMLALTALVSFAVYVMVRKRSVEAVAHGNPAELKSAFFFGALYAVVLLAVAAAQDQFGARGLYTIAALSGLHDLDAITLSTARLVDQHQAQADVGWRLILIASLANFITKGGIVALIGNRRLLGWIVLPFLAAVLGGIALLRFWPSHDIVVSLSIVQE